MSKITEEQFNILIKSAITQDNIPTATLKIIDEIEKIKVSEDVIDHIANTTMCLQKNYLDILMELKDTNPGLKEFLNSIKVNDIIDNQKMEKENSFLIGLYMQTNKQSAIDKLTKKIKTKGIITEKDIVNIHHTLLYGTSSENDIEQRDNNFKFTGRKFQNGKIEIDYFAIDYKDIPDALKKLTNIYNNPTGNPDIDTNVFLKPFIIHGLFGALQLFEDGNTRMGRLMQHALMWIELNKQMGYSFELPPIYATRSYYPMRTQCREKIKNIVIQNNSDIWNEWFHFNLNRVEDQIYYNYENIKVLKRRISR